MRLEVRNRENSVIPAGTSPSVAEGEVEWRACPERSRRGPAVLRAATRTLDILGLSRRSDLHFPTHSSYLAHVMKVAIQGELGSFSHEAAERMLPRCTVVPCARSSEVFERVA